MIEFESGWSESFQKTLKGRLIAMPDIKKTVTIDGAPVYNTERSVAGCVYIYIYIYTPEKSGYNIHVI